MSAVVVVLSKGYACHCLVVVEIKEVICGWTTHLYCWFVVRPFGGSVSDQGKVKIF